MPDYLPIMLDLRGRAAIVVGGDRVAAAKAAVLHECGAHVSAISQTFCAALRRQEAAGAVSLRAKAFEAGDLAGAFVVVAATADPALAEAIWTETQARGQLVNIVDVPARCTFIMPSILRRGQLTIAVSTEGASPSLAKRVRQRLEGLFSPAWGAYLALAATARAELRRSGISYDRRDEFFGHFHDSSILASIEAGDRDAAEGTARALLEQYGVAAPMGG